MPPYGRRTKIGSSGQVTVWAGTFWGVLSVSLCAFGTQLGLGLTCFVIRHPSSVVRHPPSVIHRQSSVIHRLSSVIHRQSSTVCHSSSIIRHSSSAVLYPPSVIGRLSSVIRHPYFVVLFLYLFITFSVLFPLFFAKWKMYFETIKRWKTNFCWHVQFIEKILLLQCLKKETATAKELDLRPLGKVIIFRYRQTDKQNLPIIYRCLSRWVNRLLPLKIPTWLSNW